jgi:hypothetical protein
MVARPGQLRANFNNGELSPDMLGRSDLKMFYAGASRMARMQPVPQGGVRQMPGTRHVTTLRPRLTPATPIVNVSTGPVAAEQIVASISLAAPTAVSAVDVDALSCAGGPATIACEVFDGAWRRLQTVTVGATPIARRFALPPDVLATTRSVRLIMVDAGGGTRVVAVAGVTVRAGDAAAGVGRVLPFSYAVDDQLDLVVTEDAIDVFRGAMFQASIAHPYTPDEIRHLRVEQRLDTMLMFHENRAPRRLLRIADEDWSFAPMAFSNVPEVDLGGVYSRVAETWQLYLRYDRTAGPDKLALVVAVNGEEAAAATINVTLGAFPTYWTAFCADLKTKIEALAGVDAGITVTPSLTVTDGSHEATITFTGGNNPGGQFVLSGQVVSAANAAAFLSRTVKGDPGGEALFSAARGYAADAEFWQDRLIQAGFRSRPSAVLASALSDYFNCNIKIEQADGAILINLDTRGSEQIRQIVGARHLVIFTSEAEYYSPDRTVNRTQAVNIVQCSRHGTARGCDVVESDGDLLFVARSRSMIYAARYADVSQSYEARPISLFASHLVEDIRATALQRPDGALDAARYMLVRGDGLLVVAMLLQDQDVVAFARWPTDGVVKDVACGPDNRPLLIVERMIDGAPRLVLEEMTEGLYFDQAVTRVGEPSAVVADLAMLEGATVWAEADGHVLGPYVVRGQSITLPIAATAVTVGRWTPPELSPPPAARLVAENLKLARPVRVTTARCELIDTTSIAVGANGLPPRDQALHKAGHMADAPVRPFTGEMAVHGLAGYGPDGIVTITQTRPGRLRLRDLVIEAKT